MFINL